MARTPKKEKHLAPGQPAKPTNLSERAALEWDRIMGELAASNIRVTPAHRTALSLASTIAADIADCWRAIQEDGAYVATKNGLTAHPASKRLDALRRDYIKVLTMLGIRSAVAEPTPETGETVEDVLRG